MPEFSFLAAGLVGALTLVSDGRPDAASYIERRATFLARLLVEAERCNLSEHAAVDLALSAIRRELVSELGVISREALDQRLANEMERRRSTTQQAEPCAGDEQRLVVEFLERTALMARSRRINPAER